MDIKVNNYEDVENKIYIENLKLIKLDKNIIKLIMQGKTLREICIILNINVSYYYIRINKLKKIMRGLFNV
jgi:DNA-binding CsgD family transcriptional regulator